MIRNFRFEPALVNLQDLHNRLISCKEQETTAPLRIFLETPWGGRYPTSLTALELSKASLSWLCVNPMREEDIPLIIKIRRLAAEIFGLEDAYLESFIFTFSPLPSFPFDPLETRLSCLSKALPPQKEERLELLQKVATALRHERITKILSQKVTKLFHQIHSKIPVYGVFLGSYPSPFSESPEFFPLSVHLLAKFEAVETESLATLLSRVSRKNFLKDPLNNQALLSIHLKSKREKFLKEIAGILSKISNPEMRKLGQNNLNFLNTQKNLDFLNTWYAQTDLCCYLRDLEAAIFGSPGILPDNALFSTLLPQLNTLVEYYRESFIERASQTAVKCLQGGNTGSILIADLSMSMEISVIKKFAEEENPASDSVYSAVYNQLIEGCKGKTKLQKYRKLSQCFEFHRMKGQPMNLEEALPLEPPIALSLELQDDLKQPSFSDEKEDGKRAFSQANRTSRSAATSSSAFEEDELFIYHPKPTTQNKKKANGSKARASSSSASSSSSSTQAISSSSSASSSSSSTQAVSPSRSSSSSSSSTQAVSPSRSSSSSSSSTQAISSSSSASSSSSSTQAVSPSSSSIPGQTSFPFAYRNRVFRWWDSFNLANGFPGYENHSPEELEQQILFHGFSRCVDMFYRIGKQSSWNPPSSGDNVSHTQYMIPAEIAYKDTRYRGLIAYTIDAENRCYHRYFHIRPLNDWSALTEFYNVDFPSIQQAYTNNSQTTETVSSSPTEAAISYDEQLGVITIEDENPVNLESSVTIRLFTTYGKAFQTE